MRDLCPARFANSLPVVLWVAGAVCGCGRGAGATRRRPTPSKRKARFVCIPHDTARTQRYLKKHRQRYETALKQALRFLGRLEVDPVALKRSPIKIAGKKKLAEILDAHALIARRGPPRLQSAAQLGFRRAAQPAYRKAYHDMARVDDRTFKQNSTSYLRVAYLMDRMKMDTAVYQKHLRAIHSRLDAHLAGRGPHQQLMFRLYYKHFGLKTPFALHTAFRHCWTKRHRNPYRIGRMYAYQMTHEIFAAHRFGKTTQKSLWTAADRDYLSRALNVLTVSYLHRKNLDLAAELLTAMHVLDLHGMPVFREGLALLFKGQNENGSFGRYPRLRRRYGDAVDVKYVLHTTLVAIEALITAFSCAK
jgi:hypothetical protein